MRKRFGSFGLGLILVLALVGACAAHSGPGAQDPHSGSGGSADRDNEQVLTQDRDDQEWGIVGDPPSQGADYAEVVQRVVNMVSDSQLSSAAKRRGLDLVNVTWEDPGRAHGSSLGPNITDLTLQVRWRDASRGAEQTGLMPVIRFPNFNDRTGDIPADKFLIRVGNHRKGGRIDTVPLTDVLRNIRAFASKPWSIGGSGNLLAARDTHFLVSAQAVFLPIPKRGKAEFNPAVFNYQSAPDSPAVLTLLVTRQGTSMAVIENLPEERAVAGWGQELYFNNHGQRAAFTAERKSDVEQRIRAQGGPRTQDDRSALARGADVLFLVQVPLKHKNWGVLGGAQPASGAMKSAAEAPAPSAAPSMREAEKKSDVEQAVLGHGRDRGVYEEGRGLELVRDPKFPIRVTVQFYKATSNGVADEHDLDMIAKNIGSVYEHAEFVGSLVIPEGDPRRPTAWQKVPNEWFPW
ncbi:MAG TPA: hypothetical protein VGJ84_18930 [Polyangiaceae bacterium]|jgi:hypothetical protein